jgi:hypothetical protein
VCHKISKLFLFLLVFVFLVLTHSIGRAEDNVILDELLTEVQKTLIRVSTSLEENEQKQPPQ